MNNPKTEEIVEKLREIAGDFYFSKCIIDACVLRDTIDLIEQLQQELADERYRHDRLQGFCVAQGEELSKLKAQQRWIPVTDCPKADGRYLVTCRDVVGQRTRIVEFAKVGEDVDDYDLRGKRNVWYYFDSEYGHVEVHSVIHWMPLPEPPKEDEHE